MKHQKKTNILYKALKRNIFIFYGLPTHDTSLDWKKFSTLNQI